MLKRISIATGALATLLVAAAFTSSRLAPRLTSQQQPGKPRIAGLAAGTSQAKMDSLDLTKKTPDKVHANCAALVSEGLYRKQKEFELPTEARYWATWDTPEYQDSQRFVDTPSKTAPYGPEACIVAAPNLAFLRQTDFDDPNGVVVAAIIVNFDSTTPNQSYKRLNIGDPQYPFSCVILRHVTTTEAASTSKRLSKMAVPNFELTSVVANDEGWESYVVPSKGGSCTIGTARRIPGVRFTIRELSNPDEIPPVARWTVDRSWRTGIGVRCGEAWCNIGFDKTDLEPPAHGFGESGLAAQVSRRVIPGWFDDQRIAIPNPTGSFKIMPALHASIVPDTALNSYVIDDFKTWRPVATVHFVEDPKTTKYETAWHFRGGGEVGNLLELMMDSTGKWHARVNGREYSNFKVTRTPHEMGDSRFHIWGTARWAWRDRDELIWVGCAEGCCLVDAM